MKSNWYVYGQGKRNEQRSVFGAFVTTVGSQPDRIFEERKSHAHSEDYGESKHAFYYDIPMG